MGTTCFDTEILCFSGVSVLTNCNIEAAAEVLNQHGKTGRKENTAGIPVTLLFLFWSPALKVKFVERKQERNLWEKMVNLLRLLVLEKMKDL